MANDDDIIDVVEVEPGVYASPSQPTIPLKPRRQRQQKSKAPIVELVEGYKEGRQAMNAIIKGLFGDL